MVGLLLFLLVGVHSQDIRTDVYTSEFADGQVGELVLDWISKINHIFFLNVATLYPKLGIYRKYRDRIIVKS